MTILVVGAMEEEIDFLRSKLENFQIINKNNFEFYEGNINKVHILLVKSGVGRTMAGLLIGTAFSLGKNIDLVVNVGCAGGKPHLQIGDVVIARNTVYGDVDLSILKNYVYGQMASCPSYFTTNNEILSYITDRQAIIGDIMTNDSFTTSLNDVLEIEKKYFPSLNICCYDMESAAFAQACYYLNVPFIAIRVISDLIGKENQVDCFNDNSDFACNKSNQFMYDLLKKMK